MKRQRVRGDGPLVRCLCFTAVAAALTILTPPVGAQQRTASRDAQKLRTEFLDLKRTPNDLRVQQKYLRSFPRTYAAFLGLFEPNHELYDGFDYINVLLLLARNNEKAVGQILLRLSKGAKYEADAPSYLQQVTTQYASQHTRMFVALLKPLPIDEEAHIITFLADVEDASADPQYGETILQLKKLGEDDLARRFQFAREERQRHSH